MYVPKLRFAQHSSESLPDRQSAIPPDWYNLHQVVSCRVGAVFAAKESQHQKTMRLNKELIEEHHHSQSTSSFSLSHLREQLNNTLAVETGLHSQTFFSCFCNKTHRPLSNPMYFLIKSPYRLLSHRYNDLQL